MIPCRPFINWASSSVRLTREPIVLREAVHGVLGALPQSLSSLKLRRESGRWRVIATFVLGLQIPDRRVCSSQQSLKLCHIVGLISCCVGCDLRTV